MSRQTLTRPTRGSRRARSVASAVAVLVTGALALVPGVASAAPSSTDTNLAAGAAVSASSSYENNGDGWAAANAVDGSTDSTAASRGWSSVDQIYNAHTEWFQVDLGADSSVDKIVLWPRNDGAEAGYGFPTSATVSTSIDGSTWTDVWSVDGSALSAAPRSNTFSDTTARYVRITGQARSVDSDGSGYRMQFAEVQVFGAAVTETPAPTPAPTRGVLTPLADCYTQNADGTYTVVFGYTNDSSSPVDLAPGPDNTFTPPTYNSVLPSTFLPGAQHGVFQLTLTQADLGADPSWTLDGKKLNSGSGLPPTCSASQLPMLANGAALAGVVVLAGVFGAVVVRRQRRIVGTEVTGRG